MVKHYKRLSRGIKHSFTHLSVCSGGQLLEESAVLEGHASEDITISSARSTFTLQYFIITLNVICELYFDLLALYAIYYIENV